MSKHWPKHLPLRLDRASPAPIHRQICARLRAAIAGGHLRPGERLPSARALAVQLGVARGTVDAAYAELAGEGWIIARGPAGTVVAALDEGRGPLWLRSRAADDGIPGGLPGRSEAQPAAASAAPSRAGHVDVAHPAPRLFQMGLPALDAFPRKLWARLTARAGRMSTAASLAYPDPAGDADLREAIAAYLVVSRGIACRPGQIFITAGYQGALALIARALLRPGDEVWFEDPGYHLARRSLTDAGARLVAVPVDEEGLDVAQGRARAAQARLAVVTPAHQAPLGVALSLPRRLALLAWAAETGALVVEDDYDGEFHYVGRPLPALKSLDGGDVVIYAGSFSKVLFPALRLGYLVVPGRCAERFAAVAHAFNNGTPRLEQAIVASFMSEGHFARHLKRMRALYAARRQALAAALVAEFGSGLSLRLQAGGMHLIAAIERGSSRETGPLDAGLAAKAQEAGIAVTALSSEAVARDDLDGLLLGFTNIAERDAAQACSRLARALTRSRCVQVEST